MRKVLDMSGCIALECFPYCLTRRMISELTYRIDKIAKVVVFLKFHYGDVLLLCGLHTYAGFENSGPS